MQGGQSPPPSLVDEQLSTQPANLSSGGGGAGGAHYPFARASRKASPELRTFGKNCRGASTRIMRVTLFHSDKRGFLSFQELPGPSDEQQDRHVPTFSLSPVQNQDKPYKYYHKRDIGLRSSGTAQFPFNMTK